MGFRRGRGKIGAMYMLKTAICREIAKEDGKVCALFADIKETFDNVQRERLGG